ncbi:branched-chain amino acid transport system permease protein [Inquilinus ginsengisoli]|uniref:Branched-chain amino acid transport system permease protein n=1 Tax=Inquilinus ginsengisoli TaxID=363840 RepID=A0ABU1JKL9_9PROT|nr:branched-chain amino acid ABC transporter permease [Inquilinus ginsengisoli]MDR6289162.1 branched-chain amino acid transport system permease protein [Inquilinus ginsengisoli]
MLQYVVDGLVTGSTVALGAIGVTLTLSILRFANFTHGELLTWGAYIALTLVGLMGAGAGAHIGPLSFGWPLLLALAAAMVLTGGLAVLLDWALFGRLRGKGGMMTLAIASFGAALALRNLVVFLWGPKPDYFSRDIQIALPILPRSVLGGMRITPDQIFVLAVAVATVVGLHLFLTRSFLGKAMRGTAENAALARISGIDVRAVVRWAWMIGGGLAALAGVLSGITVQVRPLMGFDLLLPLFAAAILGGIGSLYGAVLGGLIVGLAESLSVPLIGAEYRQAVAFLVLILILLARPTGLFGERGA